MEVSKSRKKASLLVLLLVALGASASYTAYQYIGESSNSETNTTTEEVSLDQISNAIEDESGQNEQSAVAEGTNTVMVSLKEEVAQEEQTQLSTEKVVVPDENRAISQEENQSIITEETAAMVLENTAIKTSESLVKNVVPTAIANVKKKNTVADVAKLDPFNLLIKAEIEDSGVYDKFEYGIYVNSFNQKNGNIVDGKIQIYDNIRSQKISTIRTHTVSGVKDPNNRSKSVRILSSVFGYKPQEISFSLDNVDKYVTKTASTVQAMSDSLIRVDLKLERLGVGDIAVMWNVFFYKDAAIIQSKSRPELDDLLTMMKENPNMKIKLHGHTNGNSHGKVIHLGETDNDDLFNLKSSKHVETMGSAQKLSQFRAETIQHYLIKQGIDEAQIEIKGWGGKKMIHDKHSSQANLNVRVEVEILEI